MAVLIKQGMLCVYKKIGPNRMTSSRRIVFKGQIRGRVATMQTEAKREAMAQTLAMLATDVASVQIISVGVLTPALTETAKPHNLTR